jgi:hypothetical protein
MDPFLESPKVWPVFQRHFLASLGEVLLPSLGDRYRLRVVPRAYVYEQVLFTSISREDVTEEHMEIRQRTNDKLVTLIDMASPTNRTTAVGRQAYKATREAAWLQNAHVVELDWVLQGSTCLELDVSALPEFDYVVSVCRSKRQDRLELYTTTLQKRLPRIRLPLAVDDRDLVVDLQIVFARCYDRHFAGQIDYTRDPGLPLRPADRPWVDQLLKQHAG